jgi:hypothetical protein
MHTMRLWNSLHRVRSESKNGNLNIIQSFEGNETKGQKQDTQNRLRSPKPGGGEP